MAKGSSNDSSMSRELRELPHSNGGLLQSNSISSDVFVNPSQMQCVYNVFTDSIHTCQIVYWKQRYGWTDRSRRRGHCGTLRGGRTRRVVRSKVFDERDERKKQR